MTTDGGNKVIHRKARVAREEYQARAMSPARALRLALAQASDRHFDLPMVVTTVEQVEISQTALCAQFDGGGLMVLLDGPSGARGAVRLDDGLLAALIEVQTTGRVTGRASGGRAVTRTDAAIAAPLIDATLEGAEAHLHEEMPEHWADGYRFGVMMEDVRGMTLALNAAAFHVFRMTVELGDGAFAGTIAFLLPVPDRPPPRATQEDGSRTQRTLEQSAMNAPVSLEAVLSRVTVPLKQLCGLTPGDLLPFQMDRPFQIRLEASQKHVVALGRLGRVNGGWAVRLTPGEDGQTFATRPAVKPDAPPADDMQAAASQAITAPPGASDRQSADAAQADAAETQAFAENEVK